MKVRWTETSLRLRITPTELAHLQAGVSIIAAASFPGDWSVTVAPRATDVGLASAAPGALTFSLNDAALAELSDPAREGVYFEGSGLRYYIEKDFPCEHPRPIEAQEQTETFAPPESLAL